MGEITKGERKVNLIIYLLNHPDTSFSVTQLMLALNIPQGERRNVQRDLSELASQGNKIVCCEGSGTHKSYKLGMAIFDKFELPDFNEMLLKLVFLKCVTPIYPGTGDLINELLERTIHNLPIAEKEKEREVFKDISSKVLYMGKSVEMDENSSEKLKTILDAIRTRHQIVTTYEGRESERLPLAIVVYQGSVYIACCRHSDNMALYAIKLNRIADVKKSRKVFQAPEATRAKLEKKVANLDLFDEDSEPIDVLVSFPPEQAKVRRGRQLPPLRQFPGETRQVIRRHEGQLRYTADTVDHAPQRQ